MIQPVKVAQGIYRGARPNSELEMSVLKVLGIKTILNLESGPLEASMATLDRELAWAANVNILMQHLRLSEVFAPTAQQIVTAMRILTNQACLPVYVHCKVGCDRTGVVCAAYRVICDRWPLDRAIAEMVELGFHEFPYFFWVPNIKKTIVKLANVKI